MSAHVQEINELNFEREVLASETPFLLEFHAPWCGPCKAMEPLLDSLAREKVGALKVGKIDIEACPALTTQLGVRGAPTLVMFRGGREVGRRLGAGSRSAVLALAGM
ncbi:MAG: thioredoxin family protein [Myxococcales bacterium]